MEGEVHAGPNPPLTPRQDRIEASIERVLRARGTRSELRDLVDQFADLARLLDIPAERAVARLKMVAMRAGSAMGEPTTVAVGDTAADRMAMVVRWCAARYFRAD